MKKARIGVAVLAIPAVFQLSACQWVKSGLPDKDKDYYVSQEIPPLQLPPDLENQAVAFQPAPPLVPGETEEPTISTSDPESKESTTEERVKLVIFDGGATRIQLTEPLDRSWRIVGKALSRNSIEITSRDEANAAYIVQFDPNEHEYEDGALWDEVTFFFGDDMHQEKEYGVRLVENKQLTEVIVTDADETPLSEGPGMLLLNLMYETIKADLEDNE